MYALTLQHSIYHISGSTSIVRVDVWSPVYPITDQYHDSHLSRHRAYCTVHRFRSARVRTWYHFEYRCTQSLLSGGGGGEGGRVFQHEHALRLRDPRPDCRDLDLPGRTHRGRVRRVGEE